MRKVIRGFMVFALLGCWVSGAHAQDAETQRQIDAAMKVSSGHFHAFSVPSSGAIADAAFVDKSRRSGPSKIAKQLAAGIGAADTSPVTVAVVGPSESKNAQVIRDAMAATGKKSLPMLEVIFVGSKAAADELQAAVVSFGAKFTYAPL
jgi:hypothetical protein